MELLKNNSYTLIFMIILLVGFGYIQSQINSINLNVSHIDKRLTVIETVLVMQNKYPNIVSKVND